MISANTPVPASAMAALSTSEREANEWWSRKGQVAYSTAALVAMRVERDGVVGRDGSASGGAGRRGAWLNKARARVGQRTHRGRGEAEQLREREEEEDGKGRRGFVSVLRFSFRFFIYFFFSRNRFLVFLLGRGGVRVRLWELPWTTAVWRCGRVAGIQNSLDTAHFGYGFGSLASRGANGVSALYSVFLTEMLSFKEITNQ